MFYEVLYEIFMIIKLLDALSCQPFIRGSLFNLSTGKTFQLEFLTTCRTIVNNLFSNTTLTVMQPFFTSLKLKRGSRLEAIKGLGK